MTEADSDRIQSFRWVDLFEAEARMIRILQEQPEGPTGSHLNITWQQRESASEPGCDVRSPVNGKTPIDALIEMYFRSDRFPACLRLLLERGATLGDPKIEEVLLNDPVALEAAVR